MLFTFLPLAALCLYGISLPLMKTKKTPDGCLYYPDYLSVEQCNSIKGLFIIIVFLSHSVQAVTLPDTMWNTLFTKIVVTLIGQSMVSLFLFYSGYGVMLSIDRKGSGYIKSIPSKRVLKVLLHFDIAVVLFGLVQLACGKTFTPLSYLLSLTGWTSLGNSNWYIFVILCLYLITWLSFTLAKGNLKVGFALTAALSVGMMAVLFVTKSSRVWYDTALCYAAGMAYYLYQEKTEAFLFKNKYIWYIVIAVTAALYGASLLLRRYWFMDIPRHIFFALTTVLFTMKVSVNNKILQFFGKHLFAIYILQRLPMLVLTRIGFGSPYLFILISFAVTVVLAVLFDLMLGKIDKLLFKSRTH